VIVMVRTMVALTRASCGHFLACRAFTCTLPISFC
jgi:hypothetical protein